MDWVLIASLVTAGLVLMALEVYVPGFILGSIGICLMAAAAVVCYQEAGRVAALALVSVEVVLSLVVVFSSLKYFPQTRLGRKMILATSQTGTSSQTERSVDLIGREGVAQSLLRPAGVALVDGKRLDVVAESGMIERGKPIKIVAVQENRIVVRAV